MKKVKIQNAIRERRKKRSRIGIFGTADKPGLSVFRSNLESYIQLIDDGKGVTLVSASTRDLKNTAAKKGKISISETLGEIVAKKAAEKGVTEAVFDRGEYKYHGRIKAIAEGARKGGLKI